MVVGHGRVGRREMPGLPLFLWFQPGKGAAVWVRVEGTDAGWVGAAVWVSDGFRLRVLYMLPPKDVKLPPSPCVLWRPVFIGKNTARFPTWSLNSFFLL